MIKDWPELDGDIAFRIQQYDVATRVAAGDRLVGFKLGPRSSSGPDSTVWDP